MATGILIGGAVLGGIGAIKGSKAEKAAAADQERLDAENRILYQMEIDESIKRTEQVNRRTEGLASAQIGASGFGGGSSLDTYMQTIQATHSSDVDWMQTSGASNVAIQERESAARARNARAQASSNLVSGIGGALSGASGAFKW